MRPTIRLTLGLTIAALASCLAMAAGQRDIQRVISDDALLSSAGIEPAKAEMRLPCRPAVLEPAAPPEFFACVYVQTSRDLNLFTLETGVLMSELQLTLG